MPNLLAGELPKKEEAPGKAQRPGMKKQQRKLQDKRQFRSQRGCQLTSLMPGVWHLSEAWVSHVLSSIPVWSENRFSPSRSTRNCESLGISDSQDNSAEDRFGSDRLLSYEAHFPDCNCISSSANSSCCVSIQNCRKHLLTRWTSNDQTTSK